MSGKRKVYGYVGATVVPKGCPDNHPNYLHAVHEFTKGELEELKPVGTPLIVNHTEGGIEAGECIESFLAEDGSRKAVYEVYHDGTPKKRLNAKYVRNCFTCENGPIYPCVSYAHSIKPFFDTLYKNSRHTALCEVPRRKGANIDFYAFKPKTKIGSYKSSHDSASISNSFSKPILSAASLSSSPPPPPPQRITDSNMSTAAANNRPAADNSNHQEQQNDENNLIASVPYDYGKCLVEKNEELSKVQQELAKYKQKEQEKERKRVEKSKAAADALRETYEKQFGDEWTKSSCDWDSVKTIMEKDPDARRMFSQLISCASAGNTSTVKRLEEQATELKALQEAQQKWKMEELQRRNSAAQTATTSRFPGIQTSTKRQLEHVSTASVSGSNKRIKPTVTVPQYVTPPIINDPPPPQEQDAPASTPPAQQQQEQGQLKHVTVTDVFDEMVKRDTGSATCSNLRAVVHRFPSAIVSTASDTYGNTAIDMKSMYPELYQKLLNIQKDNAGNPIPTKVHA